MDKYPGRFLLFFWETLCNFTLSPSSRIRQCCSQKFYSVCMAVAVSLLLPLPCLEWQKRAIVKVSVVVMLPRWEFLVPSEIANGIVSLPFLSWQIRWRVLNYHQCTAMYLTTGNSEGTATSESVSLNGLGFKYPRACQSLLTYLSFKISREGCSSSIPTYSTEITQLWNTIPCNWYQKST